MTEARPGVTGFLLSSLGHLVRGGVLYWLWVLALLSVIAVGGWFYYLQLRDGLIVTNINIQRADVPEQISEAFADAIRAREDKERLENQAEAYANEVVPKARGAAARKVEDAKAYRDRVIAESQGETSRFLAVLTEFEKAPAVTRQRLYLEMVEQVLGNTNNVVMDVQGGNSLIYLPLDRLMQGAAGVKSPGFSLPESINKRIE